MFYESELRFLTDILSRCRVQTQLLTPSSKIDDKIDFGFRRIFADATIYNKTVAEFFCKIEPNAVYKIVDTMEYRYILLLLPQTEKETILCIGPYLSSEITHSKILEIAERLKIDPKRVNELESHYGSLPCFFEMSRLFTALDAFFDKIWGGSDNYQVVDINSEESFSDLIVQQKKDPSDPEITAMHMKIMEARYAYENELMQAVTQGQTHKARIILSSFSNLSFETRLSDPVRNLKNYCIIMNTLLRKAAERGGVHPIYLDSLSSAFAKKIEQINTISVVQGLMADMFRSYCRLVKKHSMKNYSPLIQKTIIHIDSDITANLSLSEVAKAQNVNPSYLSWLFKQETGETLTEHVNKKRINHATKLLSTTNLQVQTIAQHCGILDVQYFSKVFKKHTGKTPKEYRELQKSN